MENHNINKLTVPITPEQIRKADLDLATIKSLNMYAEANGFVVVLTGGYATEALCGGNITRPHGDVDIHILIDDLHDSRQIFSSIEEKIVFSETTKWKTHKQTDTKSEYREDDESKSFFDRRRLEIVLYTKENTTWYVPALLIDSQGERINVQVVEINDLLAQKIHKLYLLKDGVDTSKERHTDDRDIYDLKRLLNSPNADVEKILGILAETRVQVEAEGSKVDQARKEFDYVSKQYK
ncbi:MAG: nucleotidyl transferase AbiEii/AbiGii toxin family protein [Candidatus Woesebacteria bacterium]|nr:MAG: nucleotidyl transferase AbiEii/AbiGii toxin family protein [Candidatus Woesebacteria bacterium]